MNTKSFLRAIATVLTLAATWLTGVAQAETVVSVTQVSYDTMNHPVCTAVRMNPVVFASLPADPCTLATTGSYGPDRITKNTYDVAGQLTDVVRALNITTGNGFPATLQQTYAHYTYSNNGLKQTETDANNNLTNYVYDGLDRLSQVQYPSASIGAGTANSADNEQYGYDANGNRTSWKRRDNNTIGFTYDNLNREIVKDIPGGTTADVYTTYDSLGRVTSRNFASTGGSGVSYTYDGLGRVSSTTDFNSRTIWYGYNAASAKTQITFPDAVSINYGVDVANRMVSATWGASTSLFTQAYDSLGRRISLTRPSSTGTTYGYDNLGRLTSQTNNLTGTGSDVTWGFSYTPSGQLALLTSSSTSYVYNEPTNNTATGKSYDGLNRDAGIAAPTSACGNVSGFDTRGNIICDAVRTFTYDIENRLLTKSTIGGSTDLTLTYDPEGRLSSYATSAGTTQFLYDGTDLIGEYDGVTSGHPMLARYVHGAGTDEPLVWFNGAGNTDARYLYYDYHGSVVGYANSAGTLAQLYKYDAYGVPKSASNLDSWGSTGSRFRYTGQIQLPEAKLYYYKARVYDPAMGRFLQTDPIGSKDDLDLYAYTGGDPVNGSDPTGTRDVDPETDPETEDDPKECEGEQPGGISNAEPGSEPDTVKLPPEIADGSDLDIKIQYQFANAANVLSALTKSGRSVVFTNGNGTVLNGEENGEELVPPKGFSPVVITGRPQVTTSRGQNTGHDAESLRQGWDMVVSGRYSSVAFNRTMSNGSNNSLSGQIRPDVLGMYGSSGAGTLGAVHEVLSGRQTEENMNDKFCKFPVHVSTSRPK